MSKDLNKIIKELEKDKKGYVLVYKDDQLVNVWEKEKDVYLHLLADLFAKYYSRKDLRINVKHNNESDDVVVIDHQDYATYKYIYKNVAINYGFMDLSRIDSKLEQEYKGE